MFEMFSLGQTTTLGHLVGDLSIDNLVYGKHASGAGALHGANLTTF